MTLTGTRLRYTCLGSNSDLVATLGESLHLSDPLGFLFCAIEQK